MKQSPAYKFVAKIGSKLMAAWMFFGEVMGFVTSKIILTIVYFVLIIPISLIIKEKLGIKLRKKRSSYFIERYHAFKNTDMENVW